jgi:hypothetical protein
MLSCTRPGQKVVVLFYKVFTIFTRINTLGRLSNTSGLNFPSLTPFCRIWRIDEPSLATLRALTTTDSRPPMDEASARMLTSLNRPGGAVAQLGARLDGIEEVVGSNPIGSTKSIRSSPETWVTECTGYMGNNPGPNGLSMGSSTRVSRSKQLNHIL